LVERIRAVSYFFVLLKQIAGQKLVSQARNVSSYVLSP
jgi:hypothetical protein